MPALTSTRGGDAAPFTDALSRGLARDGGLYVPIPLPRFEWPSDPSRLGTLVDSSRWAAPQVFGDLVAASVLDAAVSEALDFPAPLVETEDGVHVLELFHGATLAFKDVGARVMARLVARLDPAGGNALPRTVLVATSGDTGAAVANAFKDTPGCRVVVLFPAGRVSERQRRQVTTLGGGVVAAAVNGSFDDCQRLAKEAFADERLRARHGLTSANSINVARLLPQTFYYVHAALSLDRPARFVVPCGNLGNLCAGLLAHLAGMPADGFVAATNVNDAFATFLLNGEVEERRTVPTASSAMDVGRPSNLERIRWLFRDDPDRVRQIVRPVTVDDRATRTCIREVFERTGYVLDPHSAVAYRAHEVTDETDAPVVVLATAHPAKFPDFVEEAIGESVPVPEALAAVMDAEEDYREIEPRLSDLEQLLNGSFAHV